MSEVAALDLEAPLVPPVASAANASEAGEAPVTSSAQTAGTAVDAASELPVPPVAAATSTASDASEAARTSAVQAGRTAVEVATVLDARPYTWGQDPHAASSASQRGTGRFSRVLADVLVQLGLRGGSPAPRVRYPPQFKALVCVVIGISLSWVGNYLLFVLPTIEEHQYTPCKSNDNQLTYNAKMLFVYFLWFAVSRMSLFLPCVATRVAVVQSRTHGFCRTYCVHLVIRDGPLYIFVVGALLFWFHLMQSSDCQDRSPELYSTLKIYAIYSCMVSVLCLLLAYWHNKLLFEAAAHILEQDRGAPPDTITKLETCTYDESVFGDEEGKLYPSECAICLGAWEPEDVIKVTHCQHAFHEECIGNWLRTARTCALCRQDLTTIRRGLSRSSTESGNQMQPQVQVPSTTYGAQASL